MYFEILYTFNNLHTYTVCILCAFMFSFRRFILINTRLIVGFFMQGLWREINRLRDQVQKAEQEINVCIGLVSYHDHQKASALVMINVLVTFSFINT